MQHLNGLNPRQCEAVLATEGPLLIVAGAGAGKTKTIVHRILHLIHGGVSPSEILAVTFTNKAASEMRERIQALLTRSEGLPFIATFHGLGVTILKEHAKLLGLTRYFTILDESDSLALLKEAIRAEGLDPKEEEPRKYRAIISREKNQFVTSEMYQARAENIREEMVGKIWARYEGAKRAENALDFDDLLVESVRLLKTHPDIRARYQARWPYIHIDEYQDTNEVQYTLSKLLVGKTRNICVVGDTDQNIYSWRGANLKNMLRFEKDYPNAKIVFLEENYRSTNIILDAANAVITHNTLRVPKKLFTKRQGGEPISIAETFTENDEAMHIAEKIAALIEGGKTPSEIAILYRANFQSRVLEEAMLEHGLPYQVLGTKFFDRKEIKDLLSYIRASLNPDSLSDIKRIINLPARGIGKVTLVKLFSGNFGELPLAMQTKIKKFYDILKDIQAFSEKHLPSEVVRFVIEHTGIGRAFREGTEEEQERLENMEELVTLAIRYDSLGSREGLDALLTNAALASEQDTLEGAAEGVRLMTVHASKGLEFDVVFITGLEEGLFPHEKDANATLEELEEERRLFYVALTRAREKLYLSYATTRAIYGSRELTIPSSFLSDIPAELVTFERPGGSILQTIYLD